MLERTILTFDSEDEAVSEDGFIRELYKMKILAETGLYKDRKTGAPIPVNAMAAYITAYPLDEDDAADAFVHHILERRRDHRRALAKLHLDDASAPAVTHIMSKMQSLLHQSPCKKNRMLKLDIDTKDPEFLARLYSAMSDTEIIVAVETRGGYHVIIERGSSCQRLYKFAMDANANISVADQLVTIEDKGSPMIAIPGTTQGGFTVRLATNHWRQALKCAAMQTT